MWSVRCFVLAVCVGLSQQFLYDASCEGRCEHSYDHTHVCQCNSACHSHGDCCQDYTTLCHSAGTDTGTGTVGHSGNVSSSSGSGSCATSFNTVTEALWNGDVNRLSPSQYTVDFQTHVSSSDTTDHASASFFTHLDETVLTSRPTFKAFVTLQNNYNPAQGASDLLSSADNSEVDSFLNAVLPTKVMQTALSYLMCRGIVKDGADFRAQLRSLWFTPYARHAGSSADSSGFEHVMVGEYKSSTEVNGLHNWLAYYLKEKSRQINYLGYVGKTDPDLVALNYMWNGHHKALGSFFLGTSPEFDMALFTLCALTKTGAVQLNGKYVHIQTYDLDNVSGEQIASAYPSF